VTAAPETRTPVKPWIARMPLGMPPPTPPEAVAQLHLNECPVPPSPKVVAAVAEAAARGNRYPDARAARLSRALADRAGVPADRVVVGNGSDEILRLLAAVTLGPGDSAVMPTPTFPTYRVSTTALGAEAIAVPLTPDGANDVPAMLAAVRSDTRALFVCQPNNPSGTPVPPAMLERLVAETPEHVLLVVDEAYYEFNVADGAPEVLGLLARRRAPWAVARTFSKAYGMAGLRVGYAIVGETALAEALLKVKQAFNVSSMAQAAALAALEDEAYATSVVEACRRERERLVEGLRRMQYRPLPSAANFVSFDYGRPCGPLIAELASKGVMIRDWRDPAWETWVRITIGSAAETDAVLAALEAAR
jgi:histidinol-phosphate aminotransferase